MKTPKQLGMTQPEFDALLKVRDHLANGDIKHMTDPFEDRPDGFSFNMKRVIFEHDRGVAFDIGGWTKFIEMGLTLDRSYHLDRVQASKIEHFVWDSMKGTRRLHYPNVVRNWNSITPLHAALAISNFVMTGAPNWRGVMAIDMAQIDFELIREVERLTRRHDAVPVP